MKKIKQKAAAAAVMAGLAAQVLMPAPALAYDNITNEVIQIMGFIDQGLYLEAMQNCEQTKAWHYLSPEDIDLLEEMYNDASGAYNNYLTYGIMYTYNGTWTCTPPGESMPLMELYISDANMSYVNAYATRIRGKSLDYYIGTAYAAQGSYNSIGSTYAYNGNTQTVEYRLYFGQGYIAMTVKGTGYEDTYYFYR